MMSYVSTFWGGDNPFLSDLMPSIAAHLGVSGYEHDWFDLPDVKRYVVVLIDGLGWDITIKACQDAPYLSTIIGDATKAVVRTPTTTAASLMSLWTGLTPGQHGVVGFSFEVTPDQARFAPRYPWITTPLFLSEPLATPKSVMDKLVESGVCLSYVIAADLASSGFTQMGTRQAKLLGVTTPVTIGPDASALGVQAASQGDRAVVYIYESRLDHAGHQHGVNSNSWRKALSQVDSFLEGLRNQLADDVCLVISGDHGMVDVASNERITIDSDPQLAADLRLIGGEARFRHLYTANSTAVATRWQNRLEDNAQVLTRQEVIESEMMGPVEERYHSRIGDVVVVSTSNQAYMASVFPGEFSLVGMHGGGTSAERYVPVIALMD